LVNQYQVVLPTATLQRAKFGSSKVFFKRELFFAMDITASQASETALFTYTSTSQYGVMYGFAVENKIFHC
jgi:hypothetical protein